MKSIFATLATFAAAASANILGAEDAAITPRPGAMSLYLNTTSVNNLLQTAVPIFAYYALNNQTYDLNIEEKSLLYTFDFDSIHFNEATAATEKKFEYIPGTDKIHCHIGGFDLSALVNAEFKALKVIPFKQSGIDIHNMGIDFTLQQTPNKDMTHWTLVDTSLVTFDRIDIEMNSWILNNLVKLNRPIIDKLISSQLVPRFEKFIDWHVTRINDMVANEGSEPYDFEMPITNSASLNLTMTTAPRTDINSNLIELFFDGIFDTPQGQASKSHLYHGDVSNYPARELKGLSQQLWIHEDTIDSFLSVAHKDIFPVELNYHDVTQQFLKAFPEIHEYYGQDMMCYLKLDHIEGMNKPLTFSTDQGIIYGGKENDQITQLQVVVSNYTTYNETALIFEFNNEVVTKAHMHNMVVYPQVSHARVVNVRTVKDSIGLRKSHNLDGELYNIAQSLKSQFNAQYRAGYPLANINPTLGMIGGILKNTTISPFEQNGWVLAGFEMQADLPKKSENPDLEFIQ